jgi:molecular chaperone GrpE (heat shock protein)
VLSKALIAVANQLWRITGAIIDPDSKEPKSELSAQELKKVGNALESIKETLGGLGLKIIDRLGNPFDAGFPETVVTEESQEGISKEQIIRTIRPTLMWHQTMVQRGEIDIAVPAVKK